MAVKRKYNGPPGTWLEYPVSVVDGDVVSFPDSATAPTSDQWSTTTDAVTRVWDNDPTSTTPLPPEAPA